MTVRLVLSSRCLSWLGRDIFLVAALLLPCLTPCAAFGQTGTVTGSVVDAETREPVDEVLVELITGARQRIAFANSDAEGRFNVSGIAAGSYAVVFSRLGYELLRLDGITVGSELTALGVVALVSRAYRINPVVVSVSRIEEKALRAPASISVVDRRRIEARPAVTTVDHVRDLPGVDVVSSGLLHHGVTARGFNGVFSGALLVLTDNRWASVPSLRFNAYNLIPVTDEDLERIELVLGPGSALYGPNVDRGVMHLITRSPLDHQETTISVTGGEQEVFQATGRHAGRFNERVGYKISALYFRGRDWFFRDPIEDSLRARAIVRGADPDTLRIGARDFDAERFSGDVRLDLRLAEQTTLVLSGGLSQLGSSVELLNIGAAQGRDWRNGYGQARLRHGRLFAQSYLNFSDAGDTYTLRDGTRIVDNSLLIAGQVQHSSRLGELQRFVYGADVLRTLPRTEGTINGRNEGRDQITEFGGYGQSETRLGSKLDLIVAARADHHSHADAWVWSPRSALVFKPAEGHNLRMTYNRAFRQPSATNLFLDIRSAQDLGGLPFDVRVAGVPEDGFEFARDPSGRPLMRSPFTPPGLGGPAQQLPLDATVFWDAVVQILQSQGTDISGVPAPTAAQVATVMRTLNPTTRAFETVNDVADVEPLKPSTDNTLEFGYKGLMAGRFHVGLDLYYSWIRDFIGPLLVATPNVFLDRGSLEAYLSNYMSPAQAAQLAAVIAGIDGSGTVTGIPLATITPIRTVGDPYDVFLTNRNFGDVHLWGTDLGVTFLATDQLSLSGTYSFISKDIFRKLDGIEDVALNAPRNKATLSARYRNERRGLSLEVRGRYVDTFPVVGGVHVGRVESYALMDVLLASTVPFSRSTEIALTGTNLLDNRHREIVGAPRLGRLVLLRVRRSFN